MAVTAVERRGLCEGVCWWEEEVREDFEGREEEGMSNFLPTTILSEVRLLASLISLMETW
jgi:hypothetical protein